MVALHEKDKSVVRESVLASANDLNTAFDIITFTKLVRSAE